jgi:hypothetical protein
MEQAGIRRLVPDEDAVAPTPFAIDLGQGRAEGQHGVIAVQIETPDRLRLADRAVMRVMEQQGERGTAAAQAANGGDQLRLVPFMHDDHIGPVERGLHLREAGEGAGGQLGIVRVEGVEPCLAVVAQQVLQAPGSLGFEGEHLMPAMHQVPQHAAQEMRVAMVPAGGQRMGEVDELHAATVPGSSRLRYTASIASAIAATV